MLFKSFSKVKLALLFVVIISSIFSSCISLPSTTPNNSFSGDIQINSEPGGALIYLDGIYTGHSTPYKLENISNGSLVTLKLSGYLNSNNIVQITPNQINIINIHLIPSTIPPFPPFFDIGYLTHIDINPNYLQLSPGKIVKINSITAYYLDGTNKKLPFEKCDLLSINKNVAIISESGEITAVSEGETTIWAIYTENNVTRSDSIQVYVSEGQSTITDSLSNIDVSPSFMSLYIGQSKPISSITAHYASGIEQTINPNNCDYSVNNSFVSVSNSGIISGNAVGNSIVTVAYTENNITKTDTISVSVSDTIVGDAKYRALAVGVGDYIYYGEEGDLLAPPYDVNKMKKIFNDCQFGSNNIGFSKIKELKNTQATKTNILQGIQSTFSGADENDVSYFYFSGHGALLDQVSYLCPSDFNGNTSSAISVHELESFLSVIPGIKVVFIDTCHSGGFIGKDIARNETTNNLISEEEYLSDFNDSIINSFARYNITKDLLTSSEYQVLTSSHWYQLSYELHPPNEQPFGVFTKALYEGCSLANNIPADVNNDNKISLNEAYNYIAQWVAAMRINQDVQVHPLNSNFTIFEY